MRSGELARRAGVSSDTLRHYERKGVLPKPTRTPSGYRMYDEAAFRRVGLIQRALAVGFTLDELASVLRVRDRGGAPCARVRELAAEKLADLEQRLRDMQKLRADLRRLVEDWDARLKAHPGQRAHLLESLPARPSPSRQASLALHRVASHKLLGGRKK